MSNQLIGFGSGGAGGEQPFLAVDFDGTGDSMARGAGLTGAVNSRQGIFSCWCRIDGGDSGNLRLAFAADTTSFIIDRNSSNFFSVNVAGGGTLTFRTVATHQTSTTWKHFLASWDTNFSAGNKLSHLYINDVSDKTVTSDLSAAFDIDYTQTDWWIGSNSAPDTRWNGGLAEMYVAFGQFLDFSVEANRRKFISAAGKPVDLGPTGAEPTGTLPTIYQSVGTAGAAADFASNRGSGGGFTLTGTLGLISPSPWA